MLASKYLYDEGVTEEVYNDEWADSADMDVEDINQLEYDFLQAIVSVFYQHTSVDMYSTATLYHYYNIWLGISYLKTNKYKNFYRTAASLYSFFAFIQ